MESNWINGPFKYGLLGWELTLAARVLVGTEAGSYLTNMLDVSGQFPALFRPLGSVVFGPYFAFGFAPGARFPYGIPVEPP